MRLKLRSTHQTSSVVAQMSEYLFVYGSLKRGFGGKEASELANQMKWIGTAQVPGRLYDLGKYVGAIVEKDLDLFVKGELLEIPDSSVLKRLDEYEEYNPARVLSCLFVRQQVRARVEDGRHVDAWIYVYNRDPGDAPVIASGEYLRTLTKD